MRFYGILGAELLLLFGADEPLQATKAGTDRTAESLIAALYFLGAITLLDAIVVESIILYHFPNMQSDRDWSKGGDDTSMGTSQSY